MKNYSPLVFLAKKHTQKKHGMLYPSQRPNMQHVKASAKSRNKETYFTCLNPAFAKTFETKSFPQASGLLISHGTTAP